MPEGYRAYFEMGSSLFSTKISFSFNNIRICVGPLLNPHLPNGLSHSYQLNESIFHLRGCLVYFFSFILFRIDIPVSKQPRPAASDLGLHCLPMSQKWDARLIWVKV